MSRSRASKAPARTQPRFTLAAPIGGVVTELMVREGMTVMAGATLFRINGLATVWANAEVPESQAALLKPGAKVQARSPALPGATFDGQVQALLPEVNPGTRTLKARVELANPGRRLVPGMFVQMQFIDTRAEKSLLIPTEAVIQTGKRTLVMLAEDDGRFRPVEVELGIEAGGQTEIKRGLQAGQRVVVSSQFLIDSEASLRGVEARLNAEAEREHEMIAQLIRWSIANRFLVLLAAVMVGAWGVVSILRTPLDALPDLSDVQVIIRTSYPGQAPQIVENQVTYPLTTTMLSVPGAKTVRGYSFFGDSFVYVLFEDGTDLYWARSRVLEYLNQVQSRLPAKAKASLGPDATGVGWVYQYALVDRSGTHRPGPAARAAGLVPQVRAEERAQRGRGGDARRHGAPVPGRARSRQAARLRHRAHAGGRGGPQRPTRRPAARCSSWARPNTWCARRATCSRSTTSARSR